MPEDDNSKDSMQNFDISDTLIEALLDFDDEPDFDEDDDTEGRPDQEPDDQAVAEEKPESEVDATSSQSDDSTDAAEKSDIDEDDSTDAAEKPDIDKDDSTDAAEKSDIDKDEAVIDTGGLDAGQDPTSERPKPDTSAHERDEAIESGRVEIQTAGSDPAEDILKLVLGADLDSAEGDASSAKLQDGQHQLAEQPESKTLAPQEDEQVEEQTAPDAEAGEGISQQAPGVDSDVQDASTTEHPVRQKLVSDSSETETSAPQDDEPAEKQPVAEVDTNEDIVQEAPEVNRDVQDSGTSDAEEKTQPQPSEPLKTESAVQQDDEPVEKEPAPEAEAREKALQPVLGADSDVRETKASTPEHKIQQQRPLEPPKTGSSVQQDDEPVEKEPAPEAEAGEKILQPVLGADSDTDEAKTKPVEQQIQKKAPPEPPQTQIPAKQESEPDHDEPQTEELTDLLAEAARKRGAESSGDKEPEPVKSGRPALPEPVSKAKVEIRTTFAETSAEEKQANRQPDSDQGQHEVEEPTSQDRTPPPLPSNDDTLAVERKTKPVRENAQKSSSAGPLGTSQRRSSSAPPDHASESRVARPRPRAKTLPSLPAPQKRQLPTRPGPMQSAITFYKRGQFEDAITEFKRLLRLRPNYPSAYQLLGTAYLRNTMISEAIEAYTKLKQLQPDNIHAYENLAWIYVNLGQLDKAAIEWTQLLKLAPDRHDIRQKLKHIRSEGRKSDVKQHPRPRKKEPDSVSEGIHYLRNADFDAALQAFMALGKKQPQNTNVLGYIGGTYFKKNMMEQALSAYRKALLDKPDDVLFLENVALLELMLGHTQEALARLDELVKQNPYRSDVKKLIMSLRSVKH